MKVKSTLRVINQKKYKGRRGVTDAVRNEEPDALFHGRYRVVRRLSMGGMGAIYEVFDDKTRSRRALKVMLPEIVGG